MKWLLLLLIALIPSCSTSKKDPEKTEDEEKNKVVEKRIVGRISSVSSSGNFVLIQKYGAGALPKNAIFQSEGPEGRHASLRPSGERVRDFFAADLTSGTAKRGDAVLAYHDPKEPEPQSDKEIEPPTTEKEETTPIENPTAPKPTETPEI